MAITGPVPLPGTGMEGLMSGAASTQNIIDSMMKNRLVPYQIQQMAAEAQQATMRANLLNYLLGGPPNAFAAGGTNGTNGTNVPTGMTSVPNGMTNVPTGSVNVPNGMGGSA